MHVAAQTYQNTSTMDIPWRLTHLLHSEDYSKTRPLNTKFTNIFSIFGRIILSLFKYSFFLSVCWTNKLQLHTYNQQQISIRRQFRRRKERKSIQIDRRQRQLKLFDDAEILFMESPFETKEQRGDCAHSGETSREEMMQLRQKQNSGPLPKTALGE